MTEHAPTDPLHSARAKLAFDDADALQLVLGTENAHLKLLGRYIPVAIHVRGTELTLVGSPDDIERAKTLLEQAYELARRGAPLGSEDLVRAVKVLETDHRAKLKDIFSDTLLVTGRARPITPKGLAQKRYVEAIRKEDLVFGIGPAGTGKTYLAVAMAARALLDKRVKRIVLARPAVEAGEKLGFLPGTMEDKVNPYLRPLYDALNDMLGFERVEHLIEKGIIEVAPLAFMRGRTLNDAFVILDEAQNTTREQMKMFLTRLGFGSQAVVTGDVTQVDLPHGAKSGLADAQRILTGVSGIEFCFFTDVDVVRHTLVQAIIKAYESHQAQIDAKEAAVKGAIAAAKAADVAKAADEPAVAAALVVPDPAQS